MHLQWSSASLFAAAAVPACVSLAGIVAIHRANAGAKTAVQSAPQPE
jgi:AAHS family 4-hydroxybenzoate transporter-like MFS transporter